MVTHATQAAIFVMWAGFDGIVLPSTLRALGTSNEVLACDNSARTPTYRIGHVGILEEIPTCPRCAVLYDMAMTALEELLGRKAA